MIATFVQVLAAWCVLGFSAGISPGPLLALLLSESLRSGSAVGIRVALAPLVTDPPIIIFSIWFLGRFAQADLFLFYISLAGGLLLLVLGLSNILSKGVQMQTRPHPRRALQRGVWANLLSPHPYLFWLTVGAPLFLQSLSAGYVGPLAFVGSFYLLLVGSKVVLALLAARSQAFLSGRGYLFTIRLLGIVLCFFALTLWYEAYLVIS